MLRKSIIAGVTCIVMTASFLSGCGNDKELQKLKSDNADLQQQVESLQKENDDLKNQIAMYVPKDQTSTSTNSSDEDNQPVKLADIEIGPDAGGASVKVTMKNTSQKTVDAIEFVVLQFDNFGRPSNRFNDPSEGNVTSPINLQGTAAPGGTLHGSWTLFNMDESRKAKVVIKQVHFTDGAVWENKNFDSDVAKGKTSY